MNKRILLSSITIFSSLALATGATFAFFSDVGTSTDNVFAAGTLDLKLSDDTPETDQDDVTASFGGTDLVPGGSETAELRLKNSGTIVGDHAEVAVVNTNSDTVNPLDAVLEITTLTYDAGSVLGQLSDAVLDGGNGNGYVDLADLASQGLDSLPLTDLDTNHPLSMTVQFRSDAGDVYQGDSVDSDWTVTLNQDATQ